MDVKTFQRYEELMAVKPEDLHDYTIAGWKLIMPLTTDNVENKLEDFAQFVPGHQDEYNNPKFPNWENTSVQRHHVIRQLLFLMGLEKDVVVEKLRANLASEVARNTVTKMELKDAKDLQEVSEKTMASLGKDIERNNKSYTNLSSESQAKSEAILKMEADIDKIRSAIGELKMNKIIQGLE